MFNMKLLNIRLWIESIYKILLDSISSGPFQNVIHCLGSGCCIKDNEDGKRVNAVFLTEIPYKLLDW